MASKITGHGENTQLEAIVAEAKARGYTKQGEMFSGEVTNRRLNTKGT